MLPIIASAPTRVDLAGGTLDLWPLHYLLEHKATVNFSVNLKASVEVRLSEDGFFHLGSTDAECDIQGKFEDVCRAERLPLHALLVKALWKKGLPPISVKTNATSPQGAGLGGSSCLAIVTAAALHRAKQHFEFSPDLSAEELVRFVQDVEASLLNIPTGSQDYWGAVNGGITLISYPYGRQKIERLHPDQLQSLGEGLTLCYSGRSRLSGINNWEIFKRVIEKDSATLQAFNMIGLLAEQCSQAVSKGKFELALECSQKEWLVRKNLWPNIETPETKALDEAACKNGAHFTRVCGAGGGGVMVAFSPPAKKQAVEKAMTEAGGTVLKATICREGLRVE